MWDRVKTNKDLKQTGLSKALNMSQPGVSKLLQSRHSHPWTAGRLIMMATYLGVSPVELISPEYRKATRALRATAGPRRSPSRRAGAQIPDFQIARLPPRQPRPRPGIAPPTRYPKVRWSVSSASRRLLSIPSAEIPSCRLDVDQPAVLQRAEPAAGGLVPAAGAMLSIGNSGRLTRQRALRLYMDLASARAIPFQKGEGE